MVGGSRKDEAVVINNTNVFAALSSLRRKKKKDNGSHMPTVGGNKSKEKEEEWFWAPAPFTVKSWADVDDEDDDDYYATTAPPTSVWGSAQSDPNMGKEAIEKRRLLGILMAEKKPVIGLSWEPKLLPGLQSLKNSNISKSHVIDKAESSSLWKPNTDLLDGLFVPPNDPTKLNRLLRNRRKDVHGKGWVEMPAPTMTPELKRDLQLLKLRNVIDPKRHYKKGDPKSKALPKYFQVGHVIESSTDFFTGRLTRKERKATLADELLSDPTLRAYRKRKVREIGEKNRPAGNEKWKIKGHQSRKRAKERRL